MSQVKYRGQNDGDFAEMSDACATVNDEPSLTIQSQAEEADINVMLARMGVGARLPENPRVPMFGDFTGVTDYRSALDAIRSAEDAFNAYPAAVRARFENDPQKMLLFVEDGRNFDEAVRLGLCKPREVSRGAGSEPVGSRDQFVSSVQPNQGGGPRDAGGAPQAQPGAAGGAGGNRPA